MYRRRFLTETSLFLGAGLGLGAGLAALPARLALAAAPTDRRLVLLLLRGGLDGLHAVVPYEDPQYRALRPTLALPPPGEAGGVLDLDGDFGLHPALGPLRTLYGRGELAVLPAATTAYRDRSHFDGQNLLENGSGKAFGARDGWLNRAVAALGEGGAAGEQARLGLALGPAVPLILRGDGGVQTWSDSRLPEVSEDFLKRLAKVYASDPAFEAALAQARGAPTPEIDGMGGRRRPFGDGDLVLSARAAADLLKRPDGPRVAVMESQGWDTHFDQGRRLDALLGDISAALVALRDGLGPAWRHTAVLVVSEFGRTAAENGSRGTDHGIGGLALLAGGNLRGGRVLGDWPGLAKRNLYEGRDLQPVNAYEDLFAAALVDHLGLAPDVVDRFVLPSGRADRRLSGLFA
ncbi:MAG: DUF1501 domain-containing protein [Xanthomonadales bacterium]|nr:DUF1501 domain-containing protein [Xanthomonadales bacterium]